MSAKYTKAIKLIRFCQLWLYDEIKLTDKTKRFLELAIFCLAMGKTEMDWKALATEGLLCKNDWLRYKSLIQESMPEITWKQLQTLYE